jgi:beta-phosphoglucomutase-like phosphatase (HAD superfamily)
VTTLEAPPTDCLLITSSPADIEAAQAAGVPSIGYARTPDDAAHLVDAGAIAFVYSMAELALSLRAHRLDL